MNTDIQESNKNIVVQYGVSLNDLRSQFLKNYREEFLQIIRHVETLMGILGVSAGFGFTAFKFINNIILFFTGEILVVFSILFLIYKTHIYISGQAISTEEWLNSSIDKRREIKKALKDNNQTNLDQLAFEFIEKVNDVSDAPLLKASKDLNSSIENAFRASVLGIILIFVSFIL